MIPHPEAPIPNDLEDCPCHLGKSRNPKSDGIEICYSTGWENQEHHWFTVYPSCPHRGNIVPRWKP